MLHVATDKCPNDGKITDLDLFPGGEVEPLSHILHGSKRTGWAIKATGSFSEYQDRMPPS